MRTLFRRLRGALGLGLLWGVGGALVGGAIELVLNILPGPDLWLGVDIWPAALAIPSFVLGVLFSLVLAVAERRRSFEELSLPRIGLWGLLGGLFLGTVVGLPMVVIGAVSLLGGGLAAGTLALARRADPPAQLRDGGSAD